jgi:hypothetical protein
VYQATRNMATAGRRIDVEDTQEEAGRLAMSPKDLAALAADADGQTLLRAAELQRRAAGLSFLRRVVEDPDATEHQLQQAIGDHYWIFGGRYVGNEKAYRRLVPGDEYDIPWSERMEPSRLWNSS